MTWAFYIRSVPFDRLTIAGKTSLGGSESSCVGLARALAKRGHRVWIFCADLAENARAVDHAGVTWDTAQSLRLNFAHWHWDVFVHLRMMDLLDAPPEARWQVMWNQDLLESGGIFRKLPGNVFSGTWPLDTLAYVSEYHRRQWEGVERLFEPLGWVTKNGYDPALVPTDVERHWQRVIHISRPERGLAPLLQYWPTIRHLEPRAELRLCRYSSMYDKEGWAKVCAECDADVATVNRQVGGITWLGELDKPSLYRELAGAAVMAYPGVSTFAETSCIAAIEAQANGLPFVGSKRGALPETVPGGWLLEGKAEDFEDTSYGIAFSEAVVTLLHGCRDQTAVYEALQAAGRLHVTGYTYDAIAREWEEKAEAVFDARWRAHPLGVVRALMREEDHVAALTALEHLPAVEGADVSDEVMRLKAACEDVIASLLITPDEYNARAWTVMEDELHTGRFRMASELMRDQRRVLDVACGTGASCIRLALDHPEIRVVGVDYSEALVARAREAAATYGVADRVSFEQLTVYDVTTHQLTPEARAWLAARAGEFDGLFCGEFLEHCANLPALIDGLEAACAPGALVCYTMPHGLWYDLRKMSDSPEHTHVHHFELEDIQRVFADKVDLSGQIAHIGFSPRGGIIGTWIITYRAQPGRLAHDRDLWPRIVKTRPYQRLSVGILTDEDALDLRRCLQSVWWIADEILLGDSSMAGDEWVQVVASQYRNVRIVPVGSPKDPQAQPDGFAGARNALLDAAVGEWFLWIDSDEVLYESERLRRYLTTGPFNGYAIKQWHLMLDSDKSFDTPVRLFRRRPEIRFYGCVHEQPQWGDCNGEIMPALQLDDVKIAHRGYDTEDVRRGKAERNLPLLIRNHERFPDRVLNHLLDLREYVIRGKEAMAHRDREAAAQLFARAIHTFETKFADPADRYYALGKPWYEQALEAAAPQSWEFEVALAGTMGEMQGRRAKTERLRVRRPDEIVRYLEHRAKEITAGMVNPGPKTEPLERAS